MNQTEFVRPWMYEKQVDAIFNPARYVFCEASTKSGKTVGCCIWLGEQAVENGGENRHFWWVSPVYRQAKIAYDRTKHAFPADFFKKNDTDMVLTLENGSVIEFKSAEKPDTLYGEDVWACVFDEATRAREAAWIAIRSTLTATRGPVRIIGNVKGRRNWVYRLSRLAELGEHEDMHYAKITADDAVAAGVLDAAEIEDARRVMPEAAFNELYYCMPSEDGGNPFGLQHIQAIQHEGLSEKEPVVWGWDLARKRDWTVGIGLDIDGRIARFERFQKSWEATTQHIIAATGDSLALVDQTGVGDPIVERLISEAGEQFTGFIFTGVSRQNLMEGLAFAIQNREIAVPQESRIVTELEAFEFVHTHYGVRYEAPYVDHDDCVMALGLAVQHKRTMQWYLDATFEVFSAEKTSHWRAA